LDLVKNNAGGKAAWVTALVLACLPADTAAARPENAPRRVVSMNLCTDQLALILADPDQIRSVSYVAHDAAASVLWQRARRHAPNHGLAEEVFLMQPDLILAGAFTRRATNDILRRLGFRVETFYPAQSFDDIRRHIARLGELLHQPARSRRVLARFDDELRRATVSNRHASTPKAALYYANNYTSGSGTLAADIVARAGLRNIGTALGLDGMVKLPLELLVIEAPDVIIAEQRDSSAAALAYEAFSHPALTIAAEKARAFVRTDNSWACGAPFTVGAIERLKAAAGTAMPKAQGGTSQ